jgi:Arylsulfotransferase (ASST)
MIHPQTPPVGSGAAGGDSLETPVAPEDRYSPLCDMPDRPVGPAGRVPAAPDRKSGRQFRLWNRRRRVLGAIAPAVFAVDIALIGLFGGCLSAEYKWFPYLVVVNAQKTMNSLWEQLFPPFAPEQFIDFSGGNPGDVERNRIVVRAPVPEAAASEHFLMTGGLYQFLDYCPGYGCIAVEFTRTGSLVYAYPYRPDELAAHQIVSLPYEAMNFRFQLNMYPVGLLKLPNGDLIVTFGHWYAFPDGGGIARLRPDGSVVWFRHDYSHHWPRLLPDGEIAVPAMRIGGSAISAPLAHGVDIDLKCDGKIEEDIVRIIDQDGHVRQEIPLVDAILRSPFRGMLIDSPMPCWPMHLNSVAPVTRDIVSLYPDVSPGDLIVSFYELNAFAILGRQDGRLKHMFKGTFLRQHSVQPLGQSATVLIFDNHGADWKAGPSRLLAYDLADHAEHTILPNPHAFGINMFSDIGGKISVSPDLSRAIVTSYWQGRAYEVSIADGRVLTVFNNVHDLRSVPSAGAARERSAGRFRSGGVYYVH